MNATKASMYEKELASLKSWDSIDHMYEDRNNGWLKWIVTASHGYLVVPKLELRRRGLQNPIVSKYSYEGNLAFYLEEDCDAYKFLDELAGLVRVVR